MSTPKTLDVTFHLFHALKCSLQRGLEQHDLDLVPMQVRVLKIIEQQSPCTANDIAHLLNRDKAQVTRLLSGLLDRKILEKQPNPDDKRSQFLILTASGEHIMQLLAAMDQSLHTRMTVGISEEELACFFDVIQKMTNNLGDFSNESC